MKRNEKENYYKFPSSSTPIKQGDIFYPLPFIRGISLAQEMYAHTDNKTETYPWIDIQERDDITTVVPIVPTWGIVLTQDCDAIGSPYISFIQIGLFSEITEKAGEPKDIKAWEKFLTRTLRDFPNIYYLPPDKKLGFEEKKYANLGSIFQIERESLEKEKERLRKGRLNEVAYEHFREQIAQYFRRYPYEEHYPLSKSELEAYEKRRGHKVKKFPWHVSQQKKKS